MRERRRSGRLVLPATRPPADRALLGLSTGSGHHSDPWRVLRFMSEFVEGFDALDDQGPAKLFEALTLAQTGKIDHFPIVLLGRSYWTGLLRWLRGEALPRGVVSEEDLSLLTLTDDPEEAAELATAAPPD